MKVPKSISIDANLLEWIQRERPDFNTRFSQNVEDLIRNEVMDARESAKDQEKKRIAKRLALISQEAKRLEMEKKTLLLQMEFLEKNHGKKKPE